MDNLKLCVICCSAFSSASIIASDAARCREHLMAFCKLLAESPPKQDPELESYLEKCFPGMDEFLVDAKMSVCADCHSQITVAIEKAKEAETKEAEVRELQLKLLQEMKQLKTKYDEFQEEMTKVEKFIEMSDVSCLMYHISKTPHAKTRSANEEATNGIVLIRDRIVSVMSDLRAHQAKQESILEPKFEPMLATPPNLLEDDQNIRVWFPPPETILGSEGLFELACSEEGPITQMVMGHTIFGKCTFYPQYIDDDPENLDPDFAVEKVVSSEESDIEEEPIVAKEEIPMPMIIPQVPGIATVQYNPPARLFNLEEAVVSSTTSRSIPPQQQSNFKREVIERALRRQETRDVEFDSSLDPMIRYIIRYDVASDRLSFHNIEIKVDPYTRTLRCSACGFGRRENKRGGGSLDLEWKMKAHIMSSHIGFTCLADRCPTQTFPDHNHLIRHIRDKHPNQLIVKNIITKSSARPSAPVHQATRSSNRLSSSTTPGSRNGPGTKQIVVVQQRPPPKRRSTPPPPRPRPPPPPPKRSPHPPPIRRMSPTPAKSFSSNNVRVCPVSSCRKTFSQKEDFIRHLQAHRNQNKRATEPTQRFPTKRPSNPSSEPEIVTLD